MKRWSAAAGNASSGDGQRESQASSSAWDLIGVFAATFPGVGTSQWGGPRRMRRDLPQAGSKAALFESGDPCLSVAGERAYGIEADRQEAR